jgi:hypothetical protein
MILVSDACEDLERSGRVIRASSRPYRQRGGCRLKVPPCLHHGEAAVWTCAPARRPRHQSGRRRRGQLPSLRSRRPAYPPRVSVWDCGRQCQPGVPLAVRLQRPAWATWPRYSSCGSESLVLRCDRVEHARSRRAQGAALPTREAILSAGRAPGSGACTNRAVHRLDHPPHAKGVHAGASCQAAQPVGVGRRGPLVDDLRLATAGTRRSSFDSGPVQRATRRGASSTSLLGDMLSVPPRRPSFIAVQSRSDATAGGLPHFLVRVALSRSACRADRPITTR